MFSVLWKNPTQDWWKPSIETYRTCQRACGSKSFRSWKWWEWQSWRRKCRWAWEEEKEKRFRWRLNQYWRNSLTSPGNHQRGTGQYVKFFLIINSSQTSRMLTSIDLHWERGYILLWYSSVWDDYWKRYFQWVEGVSECECVCVESPIRYRQICFASPWPLKDHFDLQKRIPN